MEGITRAHSATGIESVPELDIDTLPEAVFELYDKIVRWGLLAPSSIRPEYAELAKRDRLKSMMAASRSFNGWAVKNDGGFVLGIHAATPVITHFAANHILRCPMVFPRLAGPERELAAVGAYQGGISLRIPPSLGLRAACVELPRTSRPRSEERAAAASILTELACAFAVLHEVAHVIGGHAEHFSTHTGLALLELHTRIPSRRLMQLREVWEYEADKIAAMMLMSLLVGADTRQTLIALFDLPTDEPEYLAGASSIALMGVYVLFLLLGQQSRHLAASDSVHPHPIVRMTYVHNAMRVIACEDLGVPAERFDHWTEQGVQSIYAAWRHLGAPIPALGRWRLFPAHRVVQREIERLQRRHRKLQPLYQNHSYLLDEDWVDPGD